MRRLTRALTAAVAATAFAVTGAATASATPQAHPGSMAAEFGTAAPSSSVRLIGDTYPSKWRDIPQDSVVDDWNMYNRECVSWAAFNIAEHGESANNYGDAKYWDDNAGQNGYQVDSNPTPGSIAQTDAGTYGHVAIVDSVHGDTATVEDYNWAGDGHYLVHDIPVGDFRYIHFYA
ncbi:CHAP domain-containing protein [Amycolatopsis jiangsuensis]|uniref:Surface antigen n=1 Tax=Amycolatopsis jiangsuensis TaxID=1181879 RepID=A0A840IMW3_9PSEU|nr:CHAP domain-containing protein [Amycolatopsis jiangsuensis]MBB4683290.1 surface antigen [Amycolatopsis jiangsuensis]